MDGADAEADGSDVRRLLPALWPRLWRFAYALCRDRELAHDLAQAACQRALEREDQYREGTRVDSWIFTILVSIWKNELRASAVRRGQGRVDAEDIDLADEGADPEAVAYAMQVLTAVSRLPEVQRIAVILVYVEGWSYKEAAEQLGVPMGTLMSRLIAAKSALAHALADRVGSEARS